MFGFIVFLHVLGFGILFGLVVPHHYSIGKSGLYDVGVGVLAYTFGLRHAFDADHIAAVDNTTRKLIADDATDRKPLSVGFWFSLGHSSIVFTLAFLLSAGVKALAGQVDERQLGPALGHRDHRRRRCRACSSGSSASSTSSCCMGIMKVFREMRSGRYDEAQLEEHLNKRGLMNRFLNGMTKSVRKPWHIYPVGLLFGLGFDTATEVGLLVLAGGAAAFALPFYSILVLPILFAAGMCLMDTIDGVFMNAAYGWAFAKPVRKVFYNITITAMSVAVALVIGTIELVSVLTEQAHITSGPLATIGSVPLDYAGYAIVGLFAASWLVAAADLALRTHRGEVEHGAAPLRRLSRTERASHRPQVNSRRQAGEDTCKTSAARRRRRSAGVERVM